MLSGSFCLCCDTSMPPFGNCWNQITAAWAWQQMKWWGFLQFCLSKNFRWIDTWMEYMSSNKTSRRDLRHFTAQPIFPRFHTLYKRCIRRRGKNHWQVSKSFGSQAMWYASTAVDATQGPAPSMFSNQMSCIGWTAKGATCTTSGKPGKPYKL